VVSVHGILDSAQGCRAPPRLAEGDMRNPKMHPDVMRLAWRVLNELPPK
jgi:hypothetical protein